MASEDAEVDDFLRSTPPSLPPAQRSRVRSALKRADDGSRTGEEIEGVAIQLPLVQKLVLVNSPKTGQT